MDVIKDGEIGLITTDNGRIVQLAIKKESQQIIQTLIAQLSKETPLVKMPEIYDLVLKSTVKTFKKIK